MKIALHIALLTLLGLFTLESAQVHAEAATPGRKLPFHGKLAAVDTSAQTITLSGKSARVFHLSSTTKITNGAGAASSLSAATVGEDVGGSYEKDAAGMMTLVSVRFGAKVKAGATAETEPAEAAPAPKATTAAAPAPAPAMVPEAQTPAAATAPAASAPAPAVAPAAEASAPMKKQRFTGKVVSVDVAGNSLVVHGKMDLTLMATAATKITGASGAATLTDATVGEKVSGSYMKAADGTMTLSTLKLGK